MDAGLKVGCMRASGIEHKRMLIDSSHRFVLPNICLRVMVSLNLDWNAVLEDHISLCTDVAFNVP